MKKILFILALFCVAGTASAQFPTQDSLIKFVNKWIRNSAVDAFTNLRLNTALIGMINQADSAGIKKVEVSGSTLRIITVGKDTFAVTLPGGGGSGNTNSNIGSGFRIAVPNTNDLKTLFVGLNLILDSSTNTNALTFKMDTAGVASYFLRRKDSTLYTTVSRLRDTAAAIRASATSGSVSSVGSGYGLTGGPITGAGTLVVDTATLSSWALRRKDSTLYATASHVDNYKPFGPERPWGVIYERATWDDISDFQTTGPATVTLNSGFIDITANTGGYDARVLVLPWYPTDLTKWKMTYRFSPTAWNASSNWFGPLLKSIVKVGSQFGYMGFTGVSNSGGGSSFFSDEVGSVLVSGGAGPSKSLNDLLEGTLERNDTVMTYTIRNVTTASATQTLTFPFPANHSTILPNLSNWGFMYQAIAGGTIQLRYIKIESQQIINPNVLIIGDSKTAIGFADNYAGRFQNQLNATYPTVTYSAGSAEYVTDALKRRAEVVKVNPEYVIIADHPANDLRDGATLNDALANLRKLYRSYSGGTTKVYVMPFPEDSTAGGIALAAMNNAIKAEYPNNYINAWDSLSISNKLKAIYNSGDGVHLTQAAMDKITQTVIASGKISTISTNRRTDSRAAGNDILQSGDSVQLAFDITKTAYNLPKWDSKYNLKRSALFDNGTYSLLSYTDNVTVPSGGAYTMNVNGEIAAFGNEGALTVFDRSDITKSLTLYDNNNIARINLNGNDGIYIGPDGSTVMGTQVSNPQFQSTLRLKNNRSFGSSQGLNGLVFNSDSATITFTNGTSLFEGSFNSFRRQKIQSSGGPTTFTNLSSVYIQDAPEAGTDITIASPWALYIGSGKLRLGTTDSVGTATGGYLFKDFTTGEVKLAPAGSGSTPALTTNQIAVGASNLLSSSSAYTYDGTTVMQQNSAAVGAVTNTASLSSTSGGVISAMTLNTPTGAAQQLGILNFGSRAGATSFNYGAAIEAVSNNTWTAGSNHRTDLLLKTANGSQSTPNERMRIAFNGNIGIGQTNPTARLHLPAGATAASSAPLKFASGSLQTTAEAGTEEYDGTNFYLSPSTTRKRIPLINDATATAGQLPVGNGTDYTVADIFPIVSVSTSGTTTLAATAKITTIKGDATSGNLTITITPNHTGQIFNIKRMDGSVNTFTIQMTSGTIDGAATKTLITQNASTQIQWDGTNAIVL